MNKEEAIQQADDAMSEAYDITVNHCLVPMTTRRVNDNSKIGGFGMNNYQLKYEVDGGETERSRFERMQISIAQMINNNMNVIRMMKGKKKKKPIVYDTVEEQRINMEMDKSVEEGLKEVDEMRKKL